MNEEDKKSKVVKLIQEASKPNPVPSRRTASNVINIKVGNGDGNGIGNTIIKTERVIHKTVAKPQPGIEHINEDQVRRLHDLKDEILRLEPLAKRDPATNQRVWSSLNKKMRVGAMRMIPAVKFKDAEKYLLMWIAQLTDRPSVKKKAPDIVKKRRISYIQTNMKKLDVEKRVRDYMEVHFSVRSLAELPDLKALERVYRYVAGLKKDVISA